MRRPRPSSTRTSPASTSPPSSGLTRESEPNTARVNIRLSQPLMEAPRAEERGIPYQLLIREAIKRTARR
jgi:predicted DNA binding CopG/RHH family protein